MASKRGRSASMALRLVATLSVSALTLLIVAGAVYAGRAGNPAAVFAGAPLTQLNGGNGVADGRNGAAIVTGKRLTPGDVRRGLVVVANESDRSAELTLSQTVLFDTPGRGGVSLAAVLQLGITQAANGESTPCRVVYAGPLAGLTTAPLGEFTAGESRTYLFTVTFPDDPSAAAAALAAEGARLSVTYQWTAAAL